MSKIIIASPVRRRRHTRRLLGAVVAGAVLAGTGLAWAGEAHASPDTDFLDALVAGGIVVFDPGVATERGRAICAAMESGANGAVIAQELFAHTSFVEMPSIGVANFWVLTAGESFCPWQHHPERERVGQVVA